MAAAGALAWVAACGSDDGDGTVAPTPTIGVAVGAPTVTVVAGQSGTSVVTLSRGGGYAGAINLTVEGAPAGVTATVNPAAVPTGTTTSTITLATAPTTAAGTYALTVRGAGTGVTAVTAPLSLVVTAVPSFTLALAPTTVSLAQGGTATTRVTLARTNFGGAIAAALTGLPAGVTATTANITGDTATLTLTAAANAAVGTATATVTGTGTGVSSQTATLGVTVTAAQATPTIAIAATPATVSVAQGGAAGTATVAITRGNGYAGAVTLAATGQPAGLTITPPAATTGTSGALSITATSAVAAGTYPITVTATGAGVANATTTFNVTVTAAAQTGGVTIAVNPTTVSLPQGGAATSTVTITRTGGFTGAVDISVTGLPANVTATITSALLTRGVSADPVTGNTATITFRAAAGTTTGAFTFNVVATATGIPTQTVAGTGTVTPGSTGGGNVALAFCAAEAPLWVGYQSDGGAWQRATLGANNQVSVSVSGTRAAIAYVTQSGTTFQTNVIYGTATELNGYGTNLCQNVAGTKSHPVTVAGLATGGSAQISLGSASATIATGNSTTITGVPAGPRDLLALRNTFAISGTSVSITPDKVILRRDVNLPNGTAIALDFNAAEAFAPASATLTVGGIAAGESAISQVALQTANGAGGYFFNGTSALLGGGNGGTQTYYGLPTDRLAATDYHLVSAVAFTTNGATPDQTTGRLTGGFFRTVANRTLNLSPALATPSVSIASSAPYVRPRVQLARQAEYASALGATFSQAGGAPRAASITALGSYLQGGTTWDLTFPDLSAAPGFDANWALRPGASTTWSVAATGGSGITTVGQTPTEGSTFQSAFRTGTIATLLRALRR